jgi:hypothetical protein
MNIYTLLSPGQTHPVYCEDYIFHQYLGRRFLIAAVMDGCSSGVESHFASSLYGKSLKKSCSILPGKINFNQLTEKEVGRFILGQLFDDVGSIQQSLELHYDELLSTILLLVYDLENENAWINVSGDGLVACNGEIREIDQDNMPDYMAYHLGGGFDEWIEHHTENMKFEHISDIAISTDGLTKLVRKTGFLTKPLDPVNYFLVQELKSASSHALRNRYQDLTSDNTYIPYDDVGVVRLIPTGK